MRISCFVEQATRRLVRPIVVLVLLGGLAGCGWRSAASLDTGPRFPDWAERGGFAGNRQAVEGARIFARVGCLSCHTYLGAGTRNVGGRDLSSIGRTSGRDAERFAAYVAHPARFGNGVMPSFADLGQRNLRRLGAFLEASTGVKRENPGRAG